MTWQDRTAIVSIWIYFIVAPIVFGFCAHTFLAASREFGAIVAAFFVAAVWPLSGLIWAGAWLAS
jgi:hypothetical protein